MLSEVSTKTGHASGGVGLLDNTAFGGGAGVVGTNGFDNCEILVLFVGDKAKDDENTDDEKFEFHCI